jgi:ATP synthase protein I
LSGTGWAAYAALFTEIGVALFVATLLGALAGHWLDQQLGTNPVFALIGFLGGAAIGAIGDYQLISRFLARFKD